MGGSYAAGPSGYCSCPKCGNRELHRAGIPCSSQMCPKCGERIIRE